MKHRFARVWFLLAGCAVLMEAILRQQAELPSLRAEVVSFRPEGRPAVISPGPDIPGCRNAEDEAKPVSWTRTIGDGDAPSLRLLVAGDSITLGEGVEPEQSYAAILASAISAQEGRPVEVVNAGVNAAGYCHVIRAVHRHMADESYDRVVIGLFADDLEQRAVTLVGGQLRADPTLVDGIIGTLATESYVLNWLWFKQLEWVIAYQTNEGRHPPAHVSHKGREIPVQTLLNFERSIRGVLDYDPLLVLIPPVGGALCPADPDPGSECAWLFDDMDRMVVTLESVGENFIDLRGLWDDGADYTQPMERRWWREHQRLPVHPSATGHERIGRALSGAPWLRKKRLSAGD
jgi:hypothetical protein